MASKLLQEQPLGKPGGVPPCQPGLVSPGPQLFASSFLAQQTAPTDHSFSILTMYFPGFAFPAPKVQASEIRRSTACCPSPEPAEGTRPVKDPTHPRVKKGLTGSGLGDFQAQLWGHSDHPPIPYPNPLLMHLTGNSAAFSTLAANIGSIFKCPFTAAPWPDPPWVPPFLTPFKSAQTCSGCSSSLTLTGNSEPRPCA